MPPGLSPERPRWSERSLVKVCLIASLHAARLQHVQIPCHQPNQPKYNLHTTSFGATMPPHKCGGAL
jgi:hypothetical protein